MWKSVPAMPFVLQKLTSSVLFWTSVKTIRGRLHGDELLFSLFLFVVSFLALSKAGGKAMGATFDSKSEIF